MELKSKLVEVRRVLEKGWCQHHRAETFSGEVVPPDDKNAVRFCIMGAVDRVVTDRDENREVLRLLHKLLPGTGPFMQSIVDFNDDSATSVDDVLALVDKAIAACDSPPGQ